jgi:hypothetical protein
MNLQRLNSAMKPDAIAPGAIKPATTATLAAFLLVAALTACSTPPKARVDQDSRANFSSYKTFAWLEPKQADSNNVKVGTLANQRVRTSLTTALQGKGLSFNEAAPDVRISYLFNVYERPKQSGVRIGLGAGGGSGNVGGGVGLSLPVGKRNESVAAMTVDVVDPMRNAQVWTGSFETVLKGTEATDGEVQKLVDTILTKYPGR